MIEKVAKDLHEGKIKPKDLNAELLNQIYADISEGASGGWGKDWQKWGDDATDDFTKLKVQENIFKFSGAKSYAQLMEFNQLAQTYKNDYETFKKEVLKVNETYNKHYLQAEFQTAGKGTHFARKWNEIQADKDLFPNLKYRTVGDDRVRETHRALNDIVKPVDDPFWNIFYPPNGWRCRCTVTQTAEKANDKKGDESIVKEEFRTHVGKTAQPFSETQPYFRITPDSVSHEIEKMFIKQSGNMLRNWAKKRLVENATRLSHKELKSSFSVSNQDIKTIIHKPHEDRIGRNGIIYNLKKEFSNAEFILTTKEDKGRDKYKQWHYFKSKQGNFYFNVAELNIGEYELHAINDNIKK